MFNNPYEVLGYLSQQCNIFQPLQQEFENIKNENLELKERMNVIGQELVNAKIENIKKDNTINVLGKEISDIKLQLTGGSK